MKGLYGGVVGGAAWARGFADPMRDAATAFRAILDAMARPGRIRTLPAADAPPPLSPAAASVALTLADGDAPAWFAPGLRGPGLEAFMRLHAGSAPAPEPAAARFLFGSWAELAPLAPDAATGTPERPDLSQTLVVEVAALTDAAGPALRGPGAPDRPRLDADGLDAAFWALLRRNAASFPLGVDVILTCGDRLAALPRTARLDD